MAYTLVAEPEVSALGVVDAELAGPWDREFFDITVSIFDPALMASMNWPWPVIVFSKPNLVASGMKPPDSVPT